MPDDTLDFFRTQPPTAERPLLGRTVLLVDDSRYACEAVRLICLRSGARIRRADSLAAADRHLRVYRPTVVIVDLGLPDGDGKTLIAKLAAAHPRVPAILAISGDDTLAAGAIAAGADGFISKPIASIAAFQSTVLACLPEAMRPSGPRPVASGAVEPDPLALRGDLVHAAALLDGGSDPRERPYVAAFLAGVAKSAGDTALAAAARLAPDPDGAAPVAALIETRLTGASRV